MERGIAWEVVKENQFFILYGFALFTYFPLKPHFTEFKIPMILKVNIRLCTTKGKKKPANRAMSFKM